MVVQNNALSFPLVNDSFSNFVLMTIADKINRFNKGMGTFVSRLNIALIALITIDVIFRYIFHITKTWVLELEWQLFALIFLMGSAFTLSEDKHVRVDIFYIKFSPRVQALVNILGYFMLLIPWCLLVVYTAFRYAYHAWQTMEGSPNPGGLPYYFIIKSIIVFAFVLLAMQGLVQILLELRKWKKWNI